MKKIIIAGAGEVGRYAAEVLSQQGHSITMVDFRGDKLQQLEEIVDVRSMKGFSCHPHTLKEAGVANCDLLIAATNTDEINLLTASMGKRMGAARVVARVHHRAYVARDLMSFCGEFDIDQIICPEQLTSTAILGNLEDPGVMAIERFAHNKVEMHQYEVKSDSGAIGTRLSELKLPSGVRLAVVDRAGHSFAPVGETRLEANDIVTLVGEQKYFDRVQHLFHDKKKARKNVVLMGGTSMGEWLAEDLSKRDYTLRLFEPNRARAIELSEKYPRITVLSTDPTEPTEFREEHLEEITAFIAVTDNDEHNILGSLQAKQLGAPITAAVIHMPTYLSLLEHLGVDWPFSPRIVAAKELLKLVDDSPVRRLAVLAPKVAEVFEMTAQSAGDAVDKWLKDVRLPSGTFIAAIQRGEDVHVPGADDMVMPNDVLVVIGPTGCERELKRLFIG